MARPNVTVLGGCTVRRIRLRGTRVAGLDIHVDGRESSVEADTVVIAAGAFETPQVLLRSGIGPADQLRRLGIPPVCDMPAVGRRFSDHPQVVLEWAPRDDHGAGADSWISGCLNFSAAGDPGCGDLQILPSDVSMSVLTGQSAGSTKPTLPLLISAMSPESTGRLRIVSDDPAVPPDIRYGYLSTTDGRARLRAGVRTALALLSTRAFAGAAAGPPDLDPRTAADDRALDRWIRGRLGTSLHASGTAPMGSADDPGTVVDQHGRVHGIDGLRIADTSILPAVPRRGPANTAVLIGELIAHSLCGS
jgi:choline dehydrogenase-like flavoprotein